MNRPIFLSDYQWTNIAVQKEPRVLLGHLHASKIFLYSTHTNLEIQQMPYNRALRHVEYPAPLPSSFLLAYFSPKRLSPPIYEVEPSFPDLACGPSRLLLSSSSCFEQSVGRTCSPTTSMEAIDREAYKELVNIQASTYQRRNPGNKP